MVTQERIRELLQGGEGISVEFKRCSGKVENDVYESICAFLNRFGGEVLLGVENDGTVTGVDPTRAASLRNNVANVVNNPDLFSPVTYLDPEIIDYAGKTIIRIRVPESSEVHSYKREIFDRDGDADVRVKSTQLVAAMYLRKQGVFTERRVFPYVSKADLRLDLLKRLRVMAQNNSKVGARHPWMELDDDQLLRSARLISRDRTTGQEGFNLAAVVLLGSDDVIGDVCPVFGTDALLRRSNVDRYDDREIVNTNLVESYDRLMAFARKHLPDTFYLENGVRISLREIITREMISNTLIHREFTSIHPAKFVIERDRMYVENACRASLHAVISPERLDPEPKNPIIASFFREIGLADRLGSGVRNLFKYSRPYGGADPIFHEADIFTISVPLSALTEVAQKTAEVAQETAEVAQETAEVAQKTAEVAQKLAGKVRKDALRNILQVCEAILDKPQVSIDELEQKTGLSNGTVKNVIGTLKSNGILSRVGSDKGGHWEIA